MPRSLPSSIRARKTMIAATTPNWAGTSRRARTSVETSVVSLAAMKLSVDQARPERVARPISPGAGTFAAPGGGDSGIEGLMADDSRRLEEARLHQGRYRRRRTG